MPNRYYCLDQVRDGKFAGAWYPLTSPTPCIGLLLGVYERFDLVHSAASASLACGLNAVVGHGVEDAGS